MSPKQQLYVPSLSDASVKAKTGRDWEGWFGLLDEEGAKKLEHKAIARLLSAKYGVPSWWRQTVAVEYERARGLRVPHQNAKGFSVAVSKTVATPLATLYEATAEATQRRKWFPTGKFELSSQTKDKYFRGAWNETSRLEMGFYAKGKDKAQIAIQIAKLASRDSVEPEREAWHAALSKLQAMLEKPDATASRSRSKPARRPARA
jgi:hypothetical protein